MWKKANDPSKAASQNRFLFSKSPRAKFSTLTLHFDTLCFVSLHPDNN